MSEYKRDGAYSRIGPQYAPFDHEISLADAELMRDFVEREFFENIARVKTPLLTDREDKTKGTVAFHGKPEHGTDGDPSVFIGGLLHHQALESWRLRIMHTKMRRSPVNQTNHRISTVLAFDVLDSTLQVALREVKVYRHVGELSVAAIERAIETGDDEQLPELQRKYYQTPIDSATCQKARDTMCQALRRASIMR